MAQLMNNDQDVEEEDDLKKRDDGEDEGSEAVADSKGHEEDEEKDQKAPEAGIGEDRAMLGGLLRFRLGGRRIVFCGGRGGAAVHEKKITDGRRADYGT